MKALKFSRKQQHVALSAALGLTLAVSSLGLSACSPSSQATDAFQKSVVAEAELDQVIASFSYDGKSQDITIRQVLEDNGALETAKTSASDYKLPSADMILSYARNQVLTELTKKENIEVSDEDILKFMKDKFNVENFDDLAKNYNLTVDQAKKMVREAVAVEKLHDRIVLDGVARPEAPQAPEVPEEGKESEATEAYASYIIALLGDEWDVQQGTWARQDGPFYANLGASNFDGKTATYEQAENAYFVAYGTYNNQSQDVLTKWTDYLNGELAKAGIQMKYLGTF